MKTRILLLLPLLLASTAILPLGPVRVRAVVANPTKWSLAGNVLGPVGWIAPDGTVSPTLKEFTGIQFNIYGFSDDTLSHIFAIYTNGTKAINVSTGNICSTTSTNGCLAKSVTIVYPANVTFRFTPLPSVLPSNFGGVGGYEYYCQVHPSMHGHITVLKSLDVDGDGSGRVDILDVAPMALAYGSSPASLTWLAAADINNDGVVNIFDVAQIAFYYGITF